MNIVIFAIIGANINASTAYWICFGLLCFFEVANAIIKVVKEIRWKND